MFVTRKSRALPWLCVIGPTVPKPPLTEGSPKAVEFLGPAHHSPLN
jgi:hypothetical protein